MLCFEVCAYLQGSQIDKLLLVCKSELYLLSICHLVNYKNIGFYNAAFFSFVRIFSLNINLDRIVFNVIS